MTRPRDISDLLEREGPRLAAFALATALEMRRQKHPPRRHRGRRAARALLLLTLAGAVAGLIAAGRE